MGSKEPADSRLTPCPGTVPIEPGIIMEGVLGLPVASPQRIPPKMKMPPLSA